MTLLLQVSDPHFGTERTAAADALKQLVRTQQPDVLMLSGDITQRATRAQFAAARSYIDALDIPHVLAIPGNHDIALFNLAERLLRPYARYSEHFGSALEGEFENEDLLLIALNTTRRYRHIDGELSDAQIDYVVRRCEQAAPACWRIVVTHQPLAVPRVDDVHDLLHGHDKALQRWASTGVDIAMGGHIHLPYVLPMHARMPALPGKLWVVQAGTALSHRVRVGAPNSVNLCRITAASEQSRQLQIERWDYSDTTRSFECVQIDPLHAPLY